MKCLLYCIFQQPAEKPRDCGDEVFIVAGGGLGAAASRCGDEQSPPGVSRLLAYAKVVSAFHAGRTVIPLRYGCMAEPESRIVELLQDRRAEYEALFGQLEGMVEMGLRVIFEAGAKRLFPAPDALHPSTPGAAYLALIRKRYTYPAALSPAEEQWANRICSSLSGIYVQQRREVSGAAGGRLVSLYFLVPRTAVEDFRLGARRAVSCEGAKSLVSGPWPPYSFVSSSG